jgi:hypothetical protein
MTIVKINGEHCASVKQVEVMNSENYPGQFYCSVSFPTNSTELNPAKFCPVDSKDIGKRATLELEFETHSVKFSGSFTHYNILVKDGAATTTMLFRGAKSVAELFAVEN